MSTATKIILGLVASVMLFFFSVGIYLVMSYISAYNYANAKENEIVAQYSQNQNMLSRLTNTISGLVEVSDLAKEQIKEVTKAALEGRYGANGNKAVVIAVQEAYPGTLDSAMYNKIMTAVESNRIAFAEEQKKLIAIKQGYDTERGSFIRGKFIALAGYPKIDLSKYNVVISDATATTFETGRDNFKIGK